MATNAITDTGITIQTLSDIESELKDGTGSFPGMKSIYGTSINLDSNSPDGQMIALIAQMKRDLLEFAQQVYASFDPDQATGAVLDQRVVINDVYRKAGTYTQVYVTVTVSAALTLGGASSDLPFIVANASGAQFTLIDDYAFTSAGSADLLFQANDRGAVEASVGTLIDPVTILYGVTSVTNAAGPTVAGVAEETDAQLRVRRAASVSKPSRGALAAISANILALDDVTAASVFENNSNATDSNGIPANTIWAIIEGGNSDEIAQVIFDTRPPGCGMKGTVLVPFETVDSATGAIMLGRVVVKFDRPTTQDLYAKFDIAALTGTVDTSALRTLILESLTWGIGAKADASSLTAFAKNKYPNATISGAQVSTDGTTWADLVSPTGLNYKFLLGTTRLYINGSNA